MDQLRPKNGETTANRKLAASIRELYRKTVNESLKTESVSDKMSDNVDKKKQANEMKSKEGPTGPLVARYHSDPSLCRCSYGAPWLKEVSNAKEKGDGESSRWPNTNPERPDQSRDPSKASANESVTGSSTRNPQEAQSNNDPYELRSLFNKGKKGKPAVTFGSDSPLGLNKESTPYAAAKNRSNCLMTSSSYATPPLRNQCVFSSPESSVQSATDKTNLTQSLKETEELRAEFSKGLSELAARQTELKDENRNYAWRSEQTLKELEA